MKKPLLISSVLLTCSAAFSQITINMADGPQVNQVVITRDDTLNTTGPGGNGPNMTWNFSTLSNHVQDTVAFSQVAGTPSAAAFSTSNLCIADPLDSAYTYLTNNSSGIWVDGVYFWNAGAWLTVKFNPAQKIVGWPSTYGTASTHTAKTDVKMAYNSPPVDSIWVKQTVNQSSNFGAWGTLTTPTGVYNVIRQDWTDIAIDSIYGHAFGSWSYMTTSGDTTKGVRWWANAQSFPVMEQELDVAGNVLSTTYLSLVTVGMKEETKNAFVLCYPNPATNEINFTTKDNAGASILVTDVQGKLIEKIIVNDVNETLNTSSWPAGVYYYSMISEGGLSLSGKFVVTH